MDDDHAAGRPPTLAHLVGQARLSKLPAPSHAAVRLALSRLRDLVARKPGATSERTPTEQSCAGTETRTTEAA